MIKLLIGGSPCTFWSIAQKNNRETEAEGMGWELFQNYLIAKEKFKPDFFLYENNKSAAKAIKDQIKKELKVYDDSFLTEDTGARYIEINSALVSAQNRQRFYVHNCGEVQQPEDRGVLLKDIIESGMTYYETQCGKAHCLSATYYKAAENPFSSFGEEARRTRIAEPVRVGALPRPNGELSTSQAMRIYSVDGKGVTQNAGGGGMGGKTGLYAVPVCVQEQVHGRKAQEDGTYDRRYEAREDGKSGTLTGTMRQNAVAVPIENVGECETIQKAIPKLVDKYGYLPEQFNAYNLSEINEKLPTLLTGSMVTSSCDTTKFEKVCDCCIFRDTNNCKNCQLKDKNVYEVKDGKITINGKEYPIKLPDGLYVIRKLTVTECCRLQTLPDDYCRAVSNTQAYKGLGNGWTAEVIIHILNGALKDVPRDEEIVVLSMYDGIGTGRYCLDKMGFTNVKYYAYEIDKYAKQISMSNYPDIIQMGDAFDLRNTDWAIEY